ncbi:hypothetical protein [Actinomadura algeriensis]|uniref:NIPSNAP protein n=1 Tax=Actinomadura algeriensis TaxID=1679523 RepID=A0ABR9JIK6_9ACTN|nr:hypothetical protein [Actinomadura algeriensis]MBE1530387.1 hypothetical protein [Actinomadura algeriensis]
MSAAGLAGWVAVKATLSPKLGGGWVDMYWASPHGRRTWAAQGPDTLVFDTMAEFEAALADTYGEDWRTSKWLGGGGRVRLELLHVQPALFPG